MTMLLLLKSYLHSKTFGSRSEFLKDCLRATLCSSSVLSNVITIYIINNKLTTNGNLDLNNTGNGRNIG